MEITSNSCHGDACNVPWHGSRKDKFPMPPHDTASAPNLKVCTKCGEAKPATTEYFRRHKAGKDGLYSQCKACTKIIGDIYRAANREMLAKKQRAYNATNQEAISERKRIHYQANREIELERKRAYRQANRKRLVEKQRAYDTANPERKKEYYRVNRERILEKKRIYRQANREQIAEWWRGYIEANHERVLEQRRIHYQANPERHRERTRVWKRAHPELNAASVRLRRARKTGAEGTHTAADIQAQYKRQKGRCFWCGEKVSDTYHVDHVVPLSRGGSNGPENLVIACPSCNSSKKDKLPHEWPQGGRLL